MKALENLFDEAERVMIHKKLSLGLANCAVIKSHDELQDPITNCPHCSGTIVRKAFWNWFRSEYNADGYDLPRGTSSVSIQSSLMFAIIPNKCVECGKTTRTRDLNKGIERFNRKKAHRAIFSKQLEV